MGAVRDGVGSTVGSMVGGKGDDINYIIEAVGLSEGGDVGSAVGMRQCGESEVAPIIQTAYSSDAAMFRAC